jgi:hypothetical protein
VAGVPPCAPLPTAASRLDRRPAPLLVCLAPARSNGFSAAGLTPAQASALAAQPGVLLVAPERTAQLRTFSSPDVLGLRGAGGLWEKQFGSATGDGAAASALVCVVDTGLGTGEGAGRRARPRRRRVVPPVRVP